VDRSAYESAADAYLAECFARQSTPRVSELAARFDSAKPAFSRAFLAAVGERPSAYLKRHQVAHAAALLRNTALSIKAVGAASGFGTTMTLIRAFRRATGCTPTQFRTKNARQ
jgi:AraC-like DNA-binding protein